jgi:hypothetical protein
MSSFVQMLNEQRWDDHRYYHHSRINQSLHLVSSLTFVCTYVLLFTHPVVGALLGWVFAMWIRQVGHFFFEPKGYDQHNQATHEEKERVKLGYNLHRKRILLAVWLASPAILYVSPTLFGVFEPHSDIHGFLDHLAKIWIALAVGAVLFRGIHLFFLEDVKTGLVWMTKIVTDPFHDIKLYYRAPIQVLRGELFDPNGPRRRHA